MNLPQPKQHKVNIHILTPIHIGAGEELDPFSFVIRNQTLILIDLMDWMERFAQKERLQAIMAAGDFIAVRSFIADNFNDPTAVKGAIPVLSHTLSKAYDKAVVQKDPKNQVLIDPITRSAFTQQPYIPGSSVKGAIRTAIANQFVKIAGVTKRDDRGREDYNKKIFGGIGKDQMRWLKISDIPLEGPSTAIFEAKEFSKSPAKPLTPKNHVEAVAGFTQIGKHVTKPVRLQLAPFKIHNQTINAEFIIDALNAFYIPKYIDEYKKFYHPARIEDIRQCAGLLNAVVKSLNTNEALIRIGHFSHAECVTLDEVRNPQTRKGRDGRYLPWGTTRTLANGIYPFGWAILEFKDLKGCSKTESGWEALLDDLPTANQLPHMPYDLEMQVNQAIESMEATKGSSDVQIEDASGRANRKDQSTTDKTSPKTGAAKTSSETQKPEPLSKLDLLMAELDLIDASDMGRLGTVIQKIDSLDTDKEKAEVARAIKGKLSKKAFKKHKRKIYLMELIEKGSD
jgi:CRISPR-associated protein Csm5